MQEIERGDSGVRSIRIGTIFLSYVSLSGNTAMKLQRKKYLPKLATEMDGFVWTYRTRSWKPPGGMVTNFKDKGDHYLLNGAKLWISIRLSVMWPWYGPKDESGRIHGLIVERAWKGSTLRKRITNGRFASLCNWRVAFPRIKVPKENLLQRSLVLEHPWVFGFCPLWNCLGVIGAAMDCYDTALRYAKERIQFGKPIASFSSGKKIGRNDHRNH